MVRHSSIKDIRGVTFKDKSGKYYYVRSAYDVTHTAIQVPPGQIVSMTCWSNGDGVWIVQDQSMTIEENVNNWKTIGYTKTDFSKDRLMKHIPAGSNCKFFSETDDFGLTIQ